MHPSVLHHRRSAWLASPWVTDREGRKPGSHEKVDVELQVTSGGATDVNLQNPFPTPISSIEPLKPPSTPPNCRPLDTSLARQSFSPIPKRTVNINPLGIGITVCAGGSCIASCRVPCVLFWRLEVQLQATQEVGDRYYFLWHHLCPARHPPDLTHSHPPFHQSLRAIQSGK